MRLSPLTLGQVAPATQGAPAAAPAAPEAAPAAATTAPGGAPATQKAPEPPGWQSFILPALMVVVFFFLFLRPRKEEKKRKQMLEELKKGDRVMTIGGMKASVVEVRGDDVVLKVDESNNTKAVYVKSAIQKVLEEKEA